MALADPAVGVGDLVAQEPAARGEVRVPVIEEPEVVGQIPRAVHIPVLEVRDRIAAVSVIVVKVREPPEEVGEIDRSVAVQVALGDRGGHAFIPSPTE